MESIGKKNVASFIVICRRVKVCMTLTKPEKFNRMFVKVWEEKTKPWIREFFAKDRKKYDRRTDKKTQTTQNRLSANL